MSFISRSPSLTALKHQSTSRVIHSRSAVSSEKQMTASRAVLIAAFTVSWIWAPTGMCSLYSKTSLTPRASRRSRSLRTAASSGEP